jgi:hypothetical protein
VGVNRVLLERVKCGEVVVGVGSVCRGMGLGCGIWGRGGKKKTILFLIP